MVRVAFIVLSVVVIDVVLLWVGFLGTMDINVLPLAQAYSAHSHHPTEKTQRDLDVLRRATAVTQFKVRAVFSALVFVVTAAGFFIAGRHSARLRIPKSRSAPSTNATLHT
jgi:hypothetical protein